MVDFFQSILSYFELIWQFFLNIITSLGNLVSAVATASVLPTTLLLYIGGPIGASVLAVSAFSVVKLLIGRSNL